MASKLVKLSTNGRRKIVTQCKAPILNNKFLGLKPTLHNNKLGKRKRSNECKTKSCSCSSSRKTLLKNYSNFIKSGLPQRLLYSQDGQWVDFSQDVIDLVKEDFRSKNTAIEVKVNGCHFILQIVYMTHLDLKTGVQKPIAWIDETGTCFFPEVYSNCHGNHEDFDFGESEIKLCLEIELNGLSAANKFEECMGESNVKRVKVDQESQKNLIECDENAPEKSDEYASPVSESVCGDVDVETGRDMFVMGFGQDLRVEIVDVKKCCGSFMEARKKLFQTQVEITRKIRGKANVVYAWCVANGDAPSGVLFHEQKLGMFGYGVHLAALHSAHSSAINCDIDENTLRHMVLCRVILGNPEVVQPGSKQFHPSDQSFDSGVDDLQNPNSYVIWNMDMNTHIFPECRISFKLPPTLKDNPVIEESRVEKSRVTTTHDPHSNSSSGKNAPLENVPSVGSSAPKDPKSPWMPFSMLFEAVSAKVGPNDMRLVHDYYESFRAKKMNREEFIKKLRCVVGDQILRSTISSLQCKNVENSGSVSDVKEVQEG